MKNSDFCLQSVFIKEKHCIYLIESLIIKVHCGKGTPQDAIKVISFVDCHRNRDHRWASDTKDVIVFDEWKQLEFVQIFHLEFETS